MWARPLILWRCDMAFIEPMHRSKPNITYLLTLILCLNNAIFPNLGLCAACWAHFMCHHELWPAWMSHPFSLLNSSSGFVWGKHYQIITLLIFRLVLQNFAFFPGCFGDSNVYRLCLHSLYGLHGPAVHYPRKAVKLNHPPTHWLDVSDLNKFEVWYSRDPL